MRGVFEDDEQELVSPRRDTELTLGAGTLLFLFFGLVLLCGICFGLGYTVGRRGAQPAAATVPQPARGDQEPLQASGAIPKPSATQQAAVALPVPPDASTAPGTAAAGQNSDPGAQPAVAASQPEVRPALNTTTAAPPPAAGVHPALGADGPFMVQIAAVATPEDAEVLMAALHKRGYAVTVRRDLADNLIHVRIGPFGTRNAAGQWRQKLLNDGYNAIVQP